MSTLTEIEEAFSKLSANEQAELLLRLAGSLHLRGSISESRVFSREEMQRWFEEDERDGLRLRRELGL